MSERISDLKHRYKDLIDFYKTKNIAVLMGGISSEREVSIRSGENVYNALVNLGFRVVKMDVDANIARRLVKDNVDVAVIMLHGRYGEDGVIQGVLEMLGIPYTGCDVLTSAIGMNKIFTKEILKANSIPTSPYIRLTPGSPDKSFEDIMKLGLPVVLKPINEGSSVGVEIIKDEDQLVGKLRSYLRRYPNSFAEKAIFGTEITIGAIGKGDNITILPIMELRPRKEFYDYEAKYTKGMTDFIIPAEISKEQEEKVIEYTKKAFSVLNCKGVVRFDAIISKEDGIPYFLEVNTIPGMTETSDIPAMAKAAGMSFEEVVLKILEYIEW
ncbi:MAG: D-alanine--D-alanine ligase [Brevinematales bacterium]|nr:D-alanine--D-alanine ligase [Brevinematales bacterium]